MKLPTVEYPVPVGYGAHMYEGDVHIQIVIDENGNVESAKGISGHPLFRLMLEKKSMTAKFKPTIVDGKAEKHRAVIVYQVTPPKFEDEATKSMVKLGIINGRARSLPKPDFPRFLQDLCADGRVEVELLLDETGNVLEAVVLSGDELLHPVALDAAKRAMFSRPLSERVLSKGIVIYNFVPDKKCIDVGNVYGKWLETPQFSIHPHSIVQEELEVIIRIGIDAYSGKVVAAKATGGHPLNRVALETEARKLTFSPSLINSPPIIAKGFIKLRIKRDRSVEVIK